MSQVAQIEERIGGVGVSADELRSLLLGFISHTREELGNFKSEIQEMEKQLKNAEEQLDMLQDAGLIVTRNLLARGVRRSSATLTKRSTYCNHACFEHAALMNPELWRGLPEELLQLVLARLPVGEVNRLRCVSKKWRRRMNAADSHFKRLCTNAHTKLFALITTSDILDFGWYAVRIYDMELNRWHVYELYAGYEEPMDTMSAYDGGLVCLVFTNKNRKNGFPILVFNPLTQDLVKLPPRGLKSMPLMVQLVTDSATKSYKVIVVGYDKKGGLVAEHFQSHTGFWTRTTLSGDVVFGYQYRWRRCSGLQGLEGTRIAPCAYDCAERQLLHLNDNSNPLHQTSEDHFAIVKDHLFVLSVESRPYTLPNGEISEFPEYCISEFRGQKSAPYWVKLRDYDCREEFGMPPRGLYFIKLFACKGFLLVTAHNNETASAFKYEFAKLYDLSTGKWSTLPMLPGCQDFSSTELMCELQWDAVP